MKSNDKFTFTDEHFSKRIAPEMSRIIKKHTKQRQWMDVAEKLNCGTSLTKQVIYRQQNLTRTVAPAVEEIYRMALKEYNNDAKAIKAIA